MKETTGSYTARHDGRALVIRTRHRPAFFVAIETLSGALGFPGLGWLSSGRALVGLIMLILGPIVVWLVIPIALSVLEYRAFTPFGPVPMLVYLGASALCSAALLYGDLRRHPHSG